MMFARALVFAVAAAALMACGQSEAPSGEVSSAPTLDAPAPESEPALAFAPSNDAAQNATGPLTMAMALRMPDAAEADRGAAPLDVLTLRGENGLVVEAEISGAMPPSTSVDGQTLRALLGLTVDVGQTLVYRVTSETKPSSGQGLCGEGAPAFLVLREPSGPGENTLKVLGVSGAAPGAAGATACPLLEYRRA